MAVMFVLSSALLASFAAAGPSFSIADLGHADFTAASINNRGQILGQVGANAIVLSGRGSVEIDGLPGFAMTLANGVNDAGLVVGTSSTPGYQFNGRAFLWQKGASVALDGDDATETSEANAINAAGQIVGARGGIAAMWDHGEVRSLGVLPNGYASSAVAINRYGQIAGVSIRGSSSAFFYDRGSLQQAGDLDGYGVAAAHALNDAGEVVGTAFDSELTPSAWRAYVWRNGVTTDLGVLQKDATWNVANAINSAGTIVGTAMFIDGATSSHAFIYDSGALRDLNTLIPPHTGWVLTGATSINDAGRIVGSGVVNGETHAFVLTPIAAVSRHR
ncbi:MAG: hypothetical protein ABW187_08060 [Dokdonella sp.]